jgi:hypothetical protein
MKSLTPEQRYKLYVRWCGSLGIVPALFTTWFREANIER